MSITWAIYDTSAPATSAYEVNKGYLNNGVLDLVNPIGVYVSKLYNPTLGQIFYVQRSIIDGNIINGIYDPNLGPFLGFEPNTYITDEFGNFISI